MIKVEKSIKTQINIISHFWREITTLRTKMLEIKAKDIKTKTKIRVDSKN
jgi:hypothetical protein